MEAAAKKGLNSNQLKLIAIIAMTVDHLAWVIWPGYQTQWWQLALHCIGRITAPTMWFFVAEGYHYTHSFKKYALRLLAFAVISHFAYNFAFGIPFIPFTTTAFNQTSVIWSLFWGLILLKVNGSDKLATWQKISIIFIACAVSFCSDWSCIATMAILYIGTYRGNFNKQMTWMMIWVAVYAAVYFLFINKVYAVIQLFAALAIPLLKSYNGERGSWKGMKWLFYIYYPAHLIICGIIRLLLHGNIGIMIGS